MTAIALRADPRRISDKPGHDRVDVAVTVSTDDGAPVGALRVTFGDPARTAPAIVQRGAVCGLSRCGIARLMRAASGSELDASFDYADTGGPPDGTYEVTVHALSESEGWV